MIILKQELFTHGPKDVAKFVNINKIARENILIITQEATLRYTIFYFADSETQEITRGFFGWD